MEELARIFSLQVALVLVGLMLAVGARLFRESHGIRTAFTALLVLAFIASLVAAGVQVAFIQWSPLACVAPIMVALTLWGSIAISRTAHVWEQSGKD